MPGRSHRIAVTNDEAENAPRLTVPYGEDLNESKPPLERRVETHTAKAQNSSTPVPLRWRSRPARITGHIDQRIETYCGEQGPRAPLPQSILRLGAPSLATRPASGPLRCRSSRPTIYLRSHCACRFLTTPIRFCTLFRLGRFHFSAAHVSALQSRFRKEFCHGVRAASLVRPCPGEPRSAIHRHVDRPPQRLGLQAGPVDVRGAFHRPVRRTVLLPAVGPEGSVSWP